MTRALEAFYASRLDFTRALSPRRFGEDDWGGWR